MKTSFFKIIALFFLFSSLCFSVSAQDGPEFSVGADVVSSYVWRGSKVSGYEGINVQPTASVSVGNLALGMWGSVNYEGSAKEADLYLSYSLGSLTLMVTDYWFGGNYFRFGKSSGTHFYEGSLAYSFGDALPLSISWNTLLYGADYKADGSKRYSSYVEVSYATSIKDIGLTLAAGASPWTSNWYHLDNDGEMKSGFQMVNISLKATKELKLSDSFSLPVFGQIVANPCSEDVNFVFGFSL